MNGRKETALENRGSDGARLCSPSAARNRDAIRAAFLAHMPLAGRVIEIGAGSGEHAVHLAAAAPDLRWLPGDPDAAARASIAAWTAHLGLRNVEAPHAADVTQADWHLGFGAADGVVSINMIHIAPFAAAAGLLAGAARLLRPGGRLFLYGPFSRNGAHTAPSNAAFDASLKARDARWGVRDLDRDVIPLAEDSGFRLVAVIPMPANNLSVVFENAARSRRPT